MQQVASRLSILRMDTDEFKALEKSKHKNNKNWGSDKIMQQTTSIPINMLKVHPRNEGVYGKERIEELAEAIRKSNWINTILVNDDNIVVSGNRRLYACTLLGIKQVPIKRVQYKTKKDELRDFLLENEYRDKTTYQKVQEAKLWEEIEQAFDSVSRDIFARKVGLGSGRTYERGKVISDKINKLEQEGKTDDAILLKMILNENTCGAKEIVDIDALDLVPKELKDQAIKNELSIKEAVSSIRRYLGIVNTHKRRIKKESTQLKIEDVIENKVSRVLKINEQKVNKARIEEVLANVKDTNKKISNVDHNAMELISDVDMFTENIGKYIDLPDFYRLNETDYENKNAIIKSITDMEDMVEKIKNILI